MDLRKIADRLKKAGKTAADVVSSVGTSIALQRPVRVKDGTAHITTPKKKPSSQRDQMKKTLDSNRRKGYYSSGYGVGH